MTTASNNQEFPPKGLNPESVWKHFAALCRIPRPSKHEERIRDHLVQWANAQGLENLIDRGGNLIIRKPASPGRENAPGIILQAHLDMVCQKNDAIAHDFLNDPIHPVIHGNLVLAENTTLGADDGIGVALALAALEDRTLVHGPLEALLTVDEEEGMGGANKLEAGILRGDILLNLDSETWGDFCLGCAGGMDISVSRPGQFRIHPVRLENYLHPCRRSARRTLRHQYPRRTRKCHQNTGTGIECAAIVSFPAPCAPDRRYGSQRPAT